MKYFCILSNKLSSANDLFKCILAKEKMTLTVTGTLCQQLLKNVKTFFKREFTYTKQVKEKVK